MRESVIYQEILQEGIQLGIQLVTQQEIQQEIQKEIQLWKKQLLLSIIIRQLTRRLGEFNSILREQIEGLPIEQLEMLLEALLDFTELADLEVWLGYPGE